MNMAMNKIQNMIFLISLLFAILLSCNKSDSIRTDSDEYRKFVDILTELETGFYVSGNDSSVYFPIRDSILNEHDVDTTWLRNYMVSLKDDPEKWHEVWKQVMQRLQVMKDSLTP